MVDSLGLVVATLHATGPTIESKTFHPDSVTPLRLMTGQFNMIPLEVFLLDANNTEGLEFVSSNKPCVSSGFYPMRDGRSTFACHSVINFDGGTCGKMEVNLGDWFRLIKNIRHKNFSKH